MRKVGRIACIVAAALTVSACGGVIPRGRFAELYASLFVADAWLDANYSARAKADTTNFYQPILEEYGYTPEDYRRSVDYYLRDPDRYARILRKSADIIDARAKKIEATLAVQKYNEDIFRKAAQSVRMPIRYDTLIANGGFTDRVDIGLDEFGRYEFRKVLEDTSFFGPRLIIRAEDSLAVVTPAVEEDVNLNPDLTRPITLSAHKPLNSNIKISEGEL